MVESQFVDSLNKFLAGNCNLDALCQCGMCHWDHRGILHGTRCVPGIFCIYPWWKVKTVSPEELWKDWGLIQQITEAVNRTEFEGWQLTKTGGQRGDFMEERVDLRQWAGGCVFFAVLGGLATLVFSKDNRRKWPSIIWLYHFLCYPKMYLRFISEALYHLTLGCRGNCLLANRGPKARHSKYDGRGSCWFTQLMY